jgi:hypothetical protein
MHIIEEGTPFFFLPQVDRAEKGDTWNGMGCLFVPLGASSSIIYYHPSSSEELVGSMGGQGGRARTYCGTRLGRSDGWCALRVAHRAVQVGFSISSAFQPQALLLQVRNTGFRGTDLPANNFLPAN